MIIFFDVGLLFLILLVAGLGGLVAGVQWVIRNAVILSIIALVILLAKYIFLFICGPSKCRVVFYAFCDIIRTAPMALYVGFWLVELQQRFGFGGDYLGGLWSLIFGGATCLILIGLTWYVDLLLIGQLDNRLGIFVLCSFFITVVVAGIGTLFVLSDFNETIQPWIQAPLTMIHNLTGW